jgi:plasmid stabilization system protein ParE
MRVRWLRTALRNLDEEATYIAADDPKAARLAVERILNAVGALADHPAIG